MRDNAGRWIVSACEKINGQIKKQTLVADLFPSEQPLKRLVTSVLIEISAIWATWATWATCKA